MEEIKIGEYGVVSLVEVMGSDTTIEESARVSYGKDQGKKSSQRDLLRYLVRHKHSSPLEMGEVRFYLKLPIFVMRQLVRHRTANINEVSGRYKILDDHMFVPPLEDIKAQATDNKQGRGADLSDYAKAGVATVINSINNGVYSVYEELNGVHSGESVEGKYGNDFPGVAKELARVVLPLSTFTELYWKCDLKNFLDMIRLRTDPHAQKEIRDYANAMYELAKPHFPIICEAWEDYSRDAMTFSKQEMKMLANILSFGCFTTDDVEDGVDYYSNEFKLSKREVLEFVGKWEKANGY